MVGKKSGKALLREEGTCGISLGGNRNGTILTLISIGLARTDNNMEITSWPQVNMINQKNYCKPNDQMFALHELTPSSVQTRKFRPYSSLIGRIVL
jgi:hypothetical protein